jgi:hypothetical protein
MKMRSFIDVTPSDWFFEDVSEAANTYLEDGEPLITSIPYSTFQDGAPYLYEEHVAIDHQSYFTLSQLVQPTDDNPLYVYIDGVQTIYQAWYINDRGTTDVQLYSGVRGGAVVSFVSVGKPQVDRFGKPNLNAGYSYPEKVLDHGDTYIYDPFNRSYQEYCFAFGRKLKRLNVPDSDWANMSEFDVCDKWIGDKQDVYAVSPRSGKIFLPMNLNNVTLTFQYLSLENGTIRVRGGDFKATAPTGVVAFNNRFFPNAKITRAEAFHLINKLRKSFYQRFTDSEPPSADFQEVYYAYDGQAVFKLKNRYTVGDGSLKVYIGSDEEMTLITTSSGLYREFDDHTILFTPPLPLGKKVVFERHKTGSTRFKDVGYEKNMLIGSTGDVVPVGGGDTNTWWVRSVLDMENEKYNDTEYLIQGIGITKFGTNGEAVVDEDYNPEQGTEEEETWFMPKTLLTRAQAVTFLNRFRKWCINSFKL